MPGLVRLMAHLPGDLADAVCDSLDADAPSGASALMSHPDRRRCFELRLRRQCAASARGTIHSQPDVAVPALMQAMSERRYLRRDAILALAAFGEVARAAIPNLEEIRAGAVGELRIAAAVALGSIKGDCRPYVGELTGLLSDAEWDVRALAARKLGDVGSAAAPAVLRLRELGSDEERAVREAATWALGRIAGD